MASRTLKRRELRRQAEQAEQPAAVTSDAAPSGRKPAKAAAPKKKPRARKEPPRLRARWAVYDGGMKQVAVFDYNQRAAAEEKLAALLARAKGPYFLQIVKEAMPESAAVPGLPA